ncbi:MAG: undecaprenyl-diphosphate phosphatase [Parcubacteria group bacterium]
MLSFYYMEYLVAIILGFTEGATEFIPVSSSGHLILVRELLGANNVGGLAFDAVLQFSATLAIVVYFWKDLLMLFVIFLRILSRHVFLGARINLWCDFAQSRLPACEVSQKDMISTNSQKNEILFWSVVLGTIPAIVAGLFLENYMDTVFRSAKLVALTLILGSVLFWFAERVAKYNKEISLKRGVLIGLFQSLALVPGVSRSGATISGGLILGLTKDEAVRFSFLLSIPILLGAGLKKIFEVRAELFTSDFGVPVLLGSIVSFTVGLFAISFLIKYLKNHSLNLFIWYRVILAILIFVLL